MSKVLELFCEIKPRIEFGFAMVTLKFEERPLKEKRIIIACFLSNLLLLYATTNHFYQTFNGVITANLMTTLLGISGALQVTLKYFTGFMLKDGTISELMTNIQGLYEETVEDPDLQAIINRNLKKITEHWKLAYKIVIISAFIIILPLTISLEHKGQDGVILSLPYLPNDIPFYTEWMSLFTMILLFGAFFLVASDCALLYIGLAIIGSVNILKDFTVAREKDIHEYKDALKIIARRHLDTIKNINLFNEVLYMVSFLHFITTTIAFLVLFSIIRLNSTDTTAYTILIFVVSELFALCVFGEFIKFKNEELADTFYLTNWYDLELKDQRDFMLILAMMQRTNCLKSAGMYDINVFAFINICKLAMSYCAVILALTEF